MAEPEPEAPPPRLTMGDDNPIGLTKASTTKTSNTGIRIGQCRYSYFTPEK